MGGRVSGPPELAFDLVHDLEVQIEHTAPDPDHERRHFSTVRQFLRGRSASSSCHRHG
jgi:hypothetical protein